MKATRLLLVCHAGTQAQRQGRFPTAEEPIEAALPPTGEFPGTLLCAPERRCCDSAALLGHATRCGALRDCDFGRWQGRSLKELEQAEPAALSRWLQDPAATPHAGESLVALCERVGQWLDALPPGQYTAVTHPWVMRAAFIRGLQLPVACAAQLDIAPWARLRLSRVGVWRVRLGSE
ncbi:histidine phosphatase family protein [Pseudomonas sp. C2L12B]|uniref:Histidine phosphatase family protein n=1 Tax=Pseudomonas typographi TaxID=2715964 RepID=A0ABR7Z8V0_9PSED|nr:histidine phosphatase family protein [Pseudomonas typographi]MBD1589700.1 histidine phosphatase family protein [Pseudomonas typographi]MBD1601733.1 histidine phosphatase family protein [Pseudomonas typographi]